MRSAFRSMFIQCLLLEGRRLVYTAIDASHRGRGRKEYRRRYTWIVSCLMMPHPAIFRHNDSPVIRRHNGALTNRFNNNNNNNNNNDNNEGITISKAYCMVHRLPDTVVLTNKMLLNFDKILYFSSKAPAMAPTHEHDTRVCALFP